ncbi:toprim domain protein (plasmid) [Aliivibrio fischeri MJ11]|uniref:Toprim domain protein n=1 Tax=Aliivibrio fischeri (strain MJ11) TaxID=388396 RepID=B5EW42_ALIFM|nr:toprim domain-containing protein [Aliivibrio fischeri]ACH64804.1 toprim domain protein [Aliivibrio fischeri MJ11]
MILGSGNNIIVESQKIASHLYNNLNKLGLVINVIATSGHLYDYQFENDYIVQQPKNIALIEQIKRLNGQSIIIATDPDPQGDLMAEHIKELTPESEHGRCIFNDVSEIGIVQSLNRFNNNEFSFNQSQAFKAALIKITNLHMQRESSQSNRSNYLTTTGVTLAKQFDVLGRVNKVQQRAFNVEGKQHVCNVPITWQDALSANKISPTITRDLIADRALSGRKLSVASELQDSFINGRLSYTRTDFQRLPSIAEQVLSEYTLSGELIQHDQHLDFQSNTAHYAIYNLSSPITPIEYLIKEQNRTALSHKFNDCSSINFSSESVLARTGRFLGSQITIAPENEIAYLLAKSKDTSPSNLEFSAQKYAKLFYNGTHCNSQLISSTLKHAEKHYPKLIEFGLNHVLDDLLHKQEKPLSKSKKNYHSPIPEKTASLKNIVEEVNTNFSL